MIKSVNKKFFLSILLLGSLSLSSCKIRFKNRKASSIFEECSSGMSSVFSESDGFGESVFSDSNYGVEVSFPDGLENSVDTNGLNYFFITDLHIDNEEDLEKCNVLFDAISEYANENCYVDFICIGGDLTTLYFEEKQEWMSWVSRILSPLKQCNKPVFLLNGNHDDNSNCDLSSLDDDNLIFGEWNDYALDFVTSVNIVHDTNFEQSKYYYYDIQKNEVSFRVVCLDSNDRPQSSNNKLYWGFSDNQIEWLNDQVFTSYDAKYVILSHMPIDSNLNVDHRLIEYNEELINCFEEKSYFNILINSFGHVHLNYLGRNCVSIPSACTSTLFLGGNGGYSGQSLYAEINCQDIGWETVDKSNGCSYSFNLFSVNDSFVKRFAIGAGTDSTLCV